MRQAIGLRSSGRHEQCFPAKIAPEKYPPVMSPKTLRRAKAPKKAKILRSKFIYKGPIFGVRRDEVLEPNGVRATREVITHPGSVVVLPVLPDGRIVLIRQYRHATRLFMWELVAGRMDPGESIQEAAAQWLLIGRRKQYQPGSGDHRRRAAAAGAKEGGQ